MLEPLLGLPGRIKILLDRIGSSTPTRLGRLDAMVSSRAPASTALSSSTWTGEKAGYLDAAVSGRASQASVDALPQGIVDSVQRGTLTPHSTNISTTTTASYEYDVTISAVDVSKAFVDFSASVHRSNGTDFTNKITAISAQLINSTTLRFYVGDRRTPSEAMQVHWQVIEYV